MDVRRIAGFRRDDRRGILREAWFLACLHLPQGLRTGYILDPTTRAPKATTIALPDGSWCEVELVTDDTGIRRVLEGGPIRLWEQFERAWDTWITWRRPTWRRFGLTVTADAQKVWLDDPANVVG